MYDHSVTVNTQSITINKMTLSCHPIFYLTITWKTIKRIYVWLTLSNLQLDSADYSKQATYRDIIETYKSHDNVLIPYNSGK